MNATKEFVNNINKGFNDRVEAQGNKPVMEVWPDDDGFAKWVACHQDKVRTTICSVPEFASSPFCGRGIH